MEEAAKSSDPIDLIIDLVKEAEELRSYVNDKVESILVRVNNLSALYIKPRNKRKSSIPTRYIYDDDQSEDIALDNHSTIEYASDIEIDSPVNHGEGVDDSQSSRGSLEETPSMPKKLKNASDESNNDIRPYACEYCDKTYGWQMSLQRHIKESHDESPKFECRMCPKKFTRRYLLSKHELTHVRQD